MFGPGLALSLKQVSNRSCLIAGVAFNRSCLFAGLVSNRCCLFVGVAFNRCLFVGLAFNRSCLFVGVAFVLADRECWQYSESRNLCCWPSSFGNTEERRQDYTSSGIDE